MVNKISLGLRIAVLLFSIIMTIFSRFDLLAGALILGSFIGIFIWSIVDLTFDFFKDPQTQKLNLGISLLASVIPMRYFQFDQSISIIAGIVIGIFIASFVDWRAEKVMKKIETLKSKPKETGLKKADRIGFRKREIKSMEKEMRGLERKDKPVKNTLKRGTREVKTKGRLAVRGLNGRSNI